MLGFWGSYKMFSCGEKSVKDRKECCRQGDNICKRQILAETFYLENVRTLNPQQEERKQSKLTEHGHTVYIGDHVVGLEISEMTFSIIQHQSNTN